MFDLDTYLERIGLQGRPTLRQLHRAHVSAIPFENLDPRRGLPVSLEIDAIQDKLVNQRRGGYCFEHNLLFKAALEALGLPVDTLLARSRWNFPPGTLNPLTHMTLRVSIDGEPWLADVGFGAGTLLEPIPLRPDGPHDQSGWQFRLIEEADELVLQTQTSDGWRDMYALLPRPAAPIDVEVGNWFVSTRPESKFVSGLIVAATRPDGTRVGLSDWSGQLTLTERRPGASKTTEVAYDQIPALLSEHFGLDGPSLA